MRTTTRATSRTSSGCCLVSRSCLVRRITNLHEAAIPAQAGRDILMMPVRTTRIADEESHMFLHRITAITVLGLAALGFSTTGCANTEPTEDERTAEARAFVTERVDDALDSLEVDTGQREAIHAIKDVLFDEAHDMRADGKEARGEALDEWRKAEPNAERLHALVDAQLARMSQLAHDSVDSMLEVHETLSPEQRQALADRVQERVDQPRRAPWRR
jgi:periplasmic protein CpxP/Spy